MEAKPESDLVAVREKQDVNDSIADELAVSEALIDGCGVCAICLAKIKIQEAAIVKGCEHAYCTICILRWATYKENPSCPQCKNPFEFLNVHRSLDGSIHECLFEESVWLLLKAGWFVPLIVEAQDDSHEEEELLQYYYDELGDDDDDNDDDDEYDAEPNEAFLTRASSSIRIGNRRWGDNGYVRAGRKEARPLSQRSSEDYEAGSSRQPKNKEVLSNTPPTGRRAKRALKREAADKAAAASDKAAAAASDKAAAAKHHQHLQRLGRK